MHKPRRLTYANVTSSLALFLTLAGGSAYAADKITGRQIAKNAITSDHVKARSLLSTDFKLGQLPAGPAGPAGAPGPQGPAGPAGAAGSARARAFVYWPRTGVPALENSIGFTNVWSPETGIVCLQAPAGYANEQTLLTLNGYGFISFYNAQKCNGGNNIQIGIADWYGDAANMPFSIAIV